MAPGRRSVWRPDVRTWGLSEANVLHWSTVLVTLLGLFGASQSFGAFVVIRRPGNCAPSPPSLRPWLLSAATRLNKTMVHSSNQRHSGTLGFRRCEVKEVRAIKKRTANAVIWNCKMLLSNNKCCYIRTANAVIWPTLVCPCRENFEKAEQFQFQTNPMSCDPEPNGNLTIV